MSYHTDTEAIATWQRHEEPPATGGTGMPYVCRECAWTGRGGVRAFAHHRVKGHAVRGRNWPADWPDAQFSTWLAEGGER